MKTILLATLPLSALILTPAFAQTETNTETSTASTETKEEKKAKPEKITDRRHPDYIRCKRESIIGSLSRKRRVCLTNREWAQVSRDQNRLSRELAEDNTSRGNVN